MTMASTLTETGGRTGNDEQRGGSFSSSVTVLLVDDDEAFVELVADYLEREHGFATHTVTRADRALEFLERGAETVDCLVSDYRMPGTDGLELLETVTDSYPELPFVMFAGQGSEEVASRAIQRGADDYLQKDTGRIRYDLLATRIRNCVTIARQQRQLRNLYDAIEDAGHALVVTDRQGTITYANPSMAALSGYEVEELIGETPALLKSGVHDDEFYQDLWETVSNGEVWQGEVVNERKDGSRYVIDQTIAPVTAGGRTIGMGDGDDVSGDGPRPAVEGFVAINRDVTERKERERELRQFRNAVERAGHAVLMTDAEGRIEYVNEAFERITGYDREDAVGRTPAILRSGEHDEAFYRELWETITDGEVWQGEVINERKDGTQYVVDQTIAPITDADGEAVEGYVAINRDVTERRERERELRQFRKAVRHAGHGVLITDAAGTIEYVNEAFEGMTGYSSAEVIGRTPAILKSGEHDEGFYREIWETILEGEVWQGEVINERKDGTQYVVDQTIAPITATGQGGGGDGTPSPDDIEGFVAINRDVTRLKEYERELEGQNERLKEYGHTVAHDLRNPLTLLEAELETLRTVAETADCDDERVDPAAVRDRCSNVDEVVDRMRTLIDDLLTMAEQGQLVLDPDPVSLETVAAEAHRQIGSDVDLSVEDTTVDADPDRLRELLSNLLRNAVEHVGEDVVVRVGPLDFEDGFFLEDDGPGIPESDRERAFDRGFTTAEDGTGFGLAIVERIANAHGWDVAVTEGSDGGARFEFRVEGGETDR
ncbi:hybrid sensor histidine kinase/response regulator [Natronobacterium lacisalsi]|nr:PAS domain S-box protein [Halobiforma lacisalsi]